MNVHLIKKQTLEDYIRKNARSKPSFNIWYALIKRSNWEKPADIICTFNTADLIGNGSERVVFNIGGNKYRLICTYHFGVQNVHLFIKWIGTHAEYSKLCKENSQYSVSSF
tara:strand:+ start:387 stop:719 length:333 start_codon:yes stop_codon:yes gene_type:complete